MIKKLNRVDCCTKIENLETILEETHIQGTRLMRCKKCHHADYYPKKNKEMKKNVK
jgi:hypothetical protein